MSVEITPPVEAGDDSLLTATLNITGVQFRSLATTPLEIIPAPGAGKIVDVISATAREMTAPGVAHDGAEPLRLWYSGSTAAASQIVQFNPSLGRGQENNFAMAGRVLSDEFGLFFQADSIVNNLAVVCATEVDVGGSGTISVRVIAHYTIEDYT